MDSTFAKMQFKSLMIQIRYLSENADSELAQIMYRELEREVGVLIQKSRTGNQFLKNSIVNSDKSVIDSQRTG